MPSFVAPWTRLLPPDAPLNQAVPTVDVLLVTRTGRLREVTFLVDSGADISLAPRTLCEQLGLNWEAGEPLTLHGISAKPECSIRARVLGVQLIVPDVALAITIPICFADGDASLLLGREGFFDCFRIEFDKQHLLTRFSVED
jgi:hypothetical protein